MQELDTQGESHSFSSERTLGPRINKQFHIITGVCMCVCRLCNIEGEEHLLYNF